jgi:hypothetical protein
MRDRVFRVLLKDSPQSFFVAPAPTIPSPGANVDVSNECGPQSETFIRVRRQFAIIHKSSIPRTSDLVSLHTRDWSGLSAGAVS